MIFVVDDNDDDFFIICKIFSKLNYSGQIKHFSDGTELLDFIKIMPDSSHPKVIFLDINLPRDNGKVVLSKLKSMENTKNFKVVILSTSSHQKDINECFKLKADDYVQKTIEMKKMSDKLKSILDEYLLCQTATN